MSRRTRIAKLITRSLLQGDGMFNTYFARRVVLREDEDPDKPIHSLRGLMIDGLLDVDELARVIDEALDG